MIDESPTTSTPPHERARSHTERVARLLDDCGRTAAEGLELVGTALRADERLRVRWSRLSARLVDLEMRATNAANAMRDVQRQRQFDELAGALIALRGAVDVGARLRCEPDASVRVVTAGDDMVLVRCDDLRMAVLAIEIRTV